MSKSLQRLKGFYLNGRYFNRKEWLGINLERLVVYILEVLCSRYHIHIHHEKWFKNYNYGNGSDFKLEDDKGNVFVEGECKNWKNFNRPYGTEIAETEILSRFTTQAPLKLLIISYISLLTTKALEILKKHNIVVVEVGNVTVKDTRKKLFKPLLRKIYHHLKPYLSQKNLCHKTKCKSNKLTHYISNTTNNNNTQHKNTIQYDTIIKNKGKNTLLNLFFKPYKPVSNILHVYEGEQT